MSPWFEIGLGPLTASTINSKNGTAASPPLKGSHKVITDKRNNLNSSYFEGTVVIIYQASLDGPLLAHGCFSSKQCNEHTLLSSFLVRTYHYKGCWIADVSTWNFDNHTCLVFTDSDIWKCLLKRLPCFWIWIFTLHEQVPLCIFHVSWVWHLNHRRKACQAGTCRSDPSVDRTHSYFCLPFFLGNFIINFIFWCFLEKNMTWLMPFTFSSNYVSAKAPSPSPCTFSDTAHAFVRQ